MKIWHVYTRWHAITFVVLLLLFSVMTYYTVRDSRGDNHTWAATLGAVSGPFTGSIARGNQSCCLAFSQSVAMYVGPVLILCILAQWLPLGQSFLARVIRIGIWMIGWLVWFAGGIVSFFHAFS